MIDPVDLGELTGAERRFAETMVRRLRRGARMIAGTFCEALVADALPGSVESEFGVAPWDLEWDGIKIEVKASRVGSWQVPERAMRDGKRIKARRADVYVFGALDGDDLDGGWEFYVIPTCVLNERGKNSITLRAIRGIVDPIGLDGLAQAVRTAAR
ncbi:hypothetical protein [Actinospongicola halichondriae]|uniref:hypothetical protein n=1 Tax=Actinospongicola halichondriae TaxID=3236844 RepID=UPI003D45D713